MEVPHYAPLNCYHSIPVEMVHNKAFTANPELSDENNRPLNRWLEKQNGFYPLFLAFGVEQAIQNTAYAHKPYRVLPKSLQPRHVLAVFNLHAIGNARVFTDMHIWTNGEGAASIRAGEEPAAEWRRKLFNSLWGSRGWYKAARQDPTRVQLLARELDLSKAMEIWAQDRDTFRAVRRAGLKNVVVRKLFTE